MLDTEICYLKPNLNYCTQHVSWVTYNRETQYFFNICYQQTAINRSDMLYCSHSIYPSILIKFGFYTNFKKSLCWDRITASIGNMIFFSPILRSCVLGRIITYWHFLIYQFFFSYFSKQDCQRNSFRQMFFLISIHNF